MHVHAVLDSCKTVTWVSWARKIVHSLKGCWVSRPTDSCLPLFYLQKIAVNEQDKLAEAVDSLLSSSWQEVAVITFVQLMMQIADA